MELAGISTITFNKRAESYQKSKTLADNLRSTPSISFQLGREAVGERSKIPLWIRTLELRYWKELAVGSLVTRRLENMDSEDSVEVKKLEF